MSITSEWTDWHLTPAGWVRGSTKRDGPGFEEKPTPDDRVMTCRWDEENMARVLHTEWKSDDEEAVQELIGLLQSLVHLLSIYNHLDTLPPFYSATTK